MREKRCEIRNQERKIQGERPKRKDVRYEIVKDARGGGELWGEGREKEKIVTTNLGTAETEKVRRRSTIQLQRFDDGHEQNLFDQIEPNGIEQIE